MILKRAGAFNNNGDNTFFGFRVQGIVTAGIKLVVIVVVLSSVSIIRGFTAGYDQPSFQASWFFKSNSHGGTTAHPRTQEQTTGILVLVFPYRDINQQV